MTWTIFLGSSKDFLVRLGQGTYQRFLVFNHRNSAEYNQEG
jgi:hypothetical protein